MTSFTYPLRAGASIGAPAALRRVVGGLHWIAVALAEQRRAARGRAELARLDAHAMRDLGLSLEELSSFEVESRGVVERTRRRTVEAWLY